jgi:thioredoxin 1
MTEESFQREVLDNAKPVLVEIGADWCGTCHIVSPIIEKSIALFKDRIKYIKLDYDANTRLIREYGVTDIPFLLFFKSGRIVDYIIGAFSGKELEVIINALIHY